MTLVVVPCSVQTARAFVAAHHRHNPAPRSGLFAVGAAVDDALVGIAIVGRPVARMLDDGSSCEITRLCTDGAPNACSILYGACARAAKALGYRRIYTYTLASEPGASLRASSWTRDADLKPAAPWSRPGRPRYDENVLGERVTPDGVAKVRWIRRLG